VAVPGLSRQLVITAVDVWAHAVQLRGTAELDSATPFWMPSAWGLATDLGSTHMPHGGGGGSLSWGHAFVPSLPVGAQELRIFVGPERTEFGVGGELPSEPALTIALPGGPLTVRRRAAVLDPAAAQPRSGFIGDVVRSPVRPARVIAVSTALDGAGERGLCVLNIDIRPEWFAVHIGGGGPLGVGGDIDRAAMGLLHNIWLATDDRGGRYAGSVCRSHSGYPWTVTATLAPALDPDARALTLTFPHPFGSGAVTATVDLL
jgi:hypothetical protein